MSVSGGVIVVDAAAFLAQLDAMFEKKLDQKLSELQIAPVQQRSTGFYDEWLSAHRFCIVNGIGNTRLNNLVKQGRVEVQRLGERKRYRLKRAA